LKNVSTFQGSSIKYYAASLRRLRGYDSPFDQYKVFGAKKKNGSYSYGIVSIFTALV
jgi:hypothetical protein